MTTNEQLIAFCIEKLAAEGIDSFVTTDPTNDESPVLRVPRLEDTRESLCQTIIYGFISCKLDGCKRKGLRMKHPLTGVPYDIFCYDPDSLEEYPDASDLMVWSANEGATFDWTNLSHGNAGWSDGWELEACDHLDQRLAFLAYLMSYEVIDLPEVAPLTLDELRTDATAEVAKGKKGRFCLAPNPNDNWHLQVNSAGVLVLHKSNSPDPLPITAEHIDAAGRLVIDGYVALTRATPL